MDKSDTYKVQCFPLYSLILAVGNPKIDFLSLNIEGSEVDVLRSLPWEEVDIEMVMVEMVHSNKTAMHHIMTEAGYREYRKTGVDTIYVKPSMRY